MTTRRASDPVRLHWGATRLFLACWCVGEIEPSWLGGTQTSTPIAWRGRVGAIWEDDRHTTPMEAMEHVESIVFGQLVSLGIKRAIFGRPDSTTRELRHR